MILYSCSALCISEYKPSIYYIKNTLIQEVPQGTEVGRHTHNTWEIGLFDQPISFPRHWPFGLYHSLYLTINLALFSHLILFWIMHPWVRYPKEDVQFHQYNVFLNIVEDVYSISWILKNVQFSLYRVVIFNFWENGDLDKNCTFGKYLSCVNEISKFFH